MKWWILFFSLLFLGTVFADEVVVSVESPVNRTYETEGTGFSFPFGWTLSVLGVGLLLFGGYLFFKKRFSFFRKKLRDAYPVRSKSVLSQGGNLSERRVVVSERTVSPLDTDIHEELEKLKEDIKTEYPQILEDDVKRVLRVTDDLLGQMPEDKVSSFVQSPDFETYKKVMKKVHTPLVSDKEAVEKLDKVLGLLENGVIDAEEARRMLGLPVRTISPVQVEKKDKGEVLKELKKVRHEEN